MLIMVERSFYDKMSETLLLKLEESSDDDD